jgi:hypothetical protein
MRAKICQSLGCRAAILKVVASESTRMLNKAKQC